jgi:hypothetical protein
VIRSIIDLLSLPLQTRGVAALSWEAVTEKSLSLACAHQRESLGLGDRGGGPRAGPSKIADLANLLARVCTRPLEGNLS